MVSSYRDNDSEEWFSMWIRELLFYASTLFLDDALSEAVKLSPKVADKLLKYGTEFFFLIKSSVMAIIL
jgi:hypothetical protein